MPNPFFQFKQFVVYHDKCAMKVGTDGVLAGAWTRVENARRMLDIGTGSGLIALMLAQRNATASVVAVDIDEGAVVQARENVERSPWKHRIEVCREDIRHVPEDWGTFDVFGGGLLSDLQKHSHLDSAQEMIEDLQERLRRFRTELSDVNMENRAELQVNIQGFLRFADYFFDNIFTDWTVLNRISESKRQVLETRTEILQILEYLRANQNAAEKQQEDTDEKLAQAVIRAKI